MKRIVLMTLMLFGLLLAFAPRVLAESGTSASHCGKCKSVCEETLKYCQKKGGKHADAKHLNVLKDCIKTCDLTSDLASRKSALHDKAANVCAEACKICAESCEAFPDDKQMKACAEECRSCASMCSSDSAGCCDESKGASNKHKESAAGKGDKAKKDSK